MTSNDIGTRPGSMTSGDRKTRTAHVQCRWTSKGLGHWFQIMLGPALWREGIERPELPANPISGSGDASKGPG